MTGRGSAEGTSPAHYTHQRGHPMVGKPSKKWMYLFGAAGLATAGAAVAEFLTHHPAAGWIYIAAVCVNLYSIEVSSRIYRVGMRRYRTAKRLAARAAKAQRGQEILDLIAARQDAINAAARALPTSPGSTRAGGQPES